MQTMQGGFKGERMTTPRLSNAPPAAYICLHARWLCCVATQATRGPSWSSHCCASVSALLATSAGCLPPPARAPRPAHPRVRHAIFVRPRRWCCDAGRSRTELLKAFPDMKNWEGVDAMPEVWWSTVRAAHPTSPHCLLRLCAADAHPGPALHVMGRLCLKIAAAFVAAVVRDAASRARRGS